MAPGSSARRHEASGHMSPGDKRPGDKKSVETRVGRTQWIALALAVLISLYGAAYMLHHLHVP